ncbi:MAG: hypothetical protein ACFFCS_29825 [Candidatus Hodarchaeota archaeon]
MIRNKEERLKFIKIYADHVLNTPDEVWSKDQNIIIDSMLLGANQMDPKSYLKLKREPCKR